MATDTTSEVPAAPERSYEALTHELAQLEKQFPPPDEAELAADAWWFAERWGTPEFEPYRGSCVAVLNGAVVAQGEDEDRLRLALARARGLHPARFVIAYIPLRGEWTGRAELPVDGQ